MSVVHTGLIIMMVFAAISAQTKISGKIQGTTLIADQSPYIITDNVIVPVGQKLVITKGCVLLFKPFTSISVEGSLIVQGDEENPVTFTSEYDTRFNRASSQFPNPFDWNGILVTQNAEKVYLSNISVDYSVYGIKSYKANIVIENGVFSSNGQSNVSINEIMKNVADGIPYSYRQESSATFNLKKTDAETLINDSIVQSSSETVQKEKKPITWKTVGKIGCIGGSSVCLAATLIFYMHAVTNQNKYLEERDITKLNMYKERRISSLTFAAVSAIPTVLFAGGAAALFIVEKRESKNKKILVSPCFGDYNGIELTLGF